MQSDLRPCPFCGIQPKAVGVFGMEGAEHPMDNDCYFRGATWPAHQWNRRPLQSLGDSPDSGALAPLREALGKIRDWLDPKVLAEDFRIKHGYDSDEICNPTFARGMVDEAIALLGAPPGSPQVEAARIKLDEAMTMVAGNLHPTPADRFKAWDCLVMAKSFLGEKKDGPPVEAPGDSLRESEEPGHPIQPLAFDGVGVLRFKENRIVTYLLDNGGIDMNKLARMEFSREDRVQFAQLIGYSLSGFGELGYVTEADFEAAERLRPAPKASSSTPRSEAEGSKSHSSHESHDEWLKREGIRGRALSTLPVPKAGETMGGTEYGYRRALESIAANSCCEGCQEAKRVAEAALAGAAPQAAGRECLTCLESPPSEFGRLCDTHYMEAKAKAAGAPEKGSARE